MSNAFTVHSTRGAIVRVAAFIVSYLLILYVAAIPKGMAPRRFADLVWGGLSSIAVYAVTMLLLANERRARRTLGLEFDRRTAARLLGGAGIGFGVYALTLMAISLVLGPIHLSTAKLPDTTTWVLVIASFLALSCMEELGFRAYPLRTLIPRIGVWPAQLSVAVLFGFSHLLFGWTWQTVMMGVIPSALLFGVTAIRSRGLAMPIGVHAAINLAQWMVGAKDTPGVWTLSTDPQHNARVASYAPWVGLAVTMLAVVAIARWSPTLEASDDATV